MVESDELACSDPVRQVLLRNRKPSTSSLPGQMEEILNLVFTTAFVSNFSIHTYYFGLPSPLQTARAYPVFYKGPPGCYFGLPSRHARSAGLHQPDGEPKGT